jgi:hypothetical protein
MKKEREPVEVGRVYRERDKRMLGRCVKVMSVDSRHAQCANCRPDGSNVSDRTTRISLKNLQTRFDLVESEAS